jgi:hypothetical protein
LILFLAIIRKQQQGGLDSVKKNALESESSIRDKDTALAPLLFYKSYNHFVTGAIYGCKFC